jgi:predicted nucleic acid-binding protein
MENTLVDTSVWIDFFNGTNNSKVETLAELIENDACLLCPVTLQEILQGIRNDKAYKKVRSLVLDLPKIDASAYKMADLAAGMYRDLRKKGITPRSSNDVLIASYAVAFDAPLLANDRDFEVIAKNTSLRLYRMV